MQQVTYADILSQFKDKEETCFCLLGLENEMFGFDKNTGKRITYEMHLQPLLKYVEEKYEWKGMYEKDYIIGAEKENVGSLTLEPGGQLEFSGAPMQNIKQVEQNLLEVKKIIDHVGEKYNINWYSIGFDPFSKVENIQLVPKERYVVMNKYLSSLGKGSYYMMRNSCTAQANFDYSDEKDMASKMRVAVALGPLIGILFASSPFQESQHSGYKSTRSWAWRNFSKQHSGFLDFVLEDDFSYKQYIDYVLQAPMYFIIRDKKVIDLSGYDFREFMQHGAKGFEPRLEDWDLHLSSVFPVARLRKVIETRTCDAGPVSNLLGQITLWKGLLYNKTIRQKVESFIDAISPPILKQLHTRGYVDGWDTKLYRHTVASLMEECIDLAKQGLQVQNPSELTYLKPIEKLVENKESLSENILKRYQKGETIKEIINNPELGFRL